jgi:hypothetical protein
MGEVAGEPCSPDGGGTGTETSNTHKSRIKLVPNCYPPTPGLLRHPAVPPTCWRKSVPCGVAAVLIRSKENLAGTGNTM